MKHSFLFLSIVLIILNSIEGKVRIRMREAKFEATRKSISEPYAFVKTYNRISVFSFGYKLNRMVKGGKMNFTFFRKYSTEKYERILNFDDVEVCKIIGKTKSASPFMQTLMSFIQSFGNINDSCLKQGEIKLSNITLDSFPLLNSIPAGEYQSDTTFFDELDENIFKLILKGNVF